jgi:hypothetical protein
MADNVDQNPGEHSPVAQIFALLFEELKLSV